MNMTQINSVDMLIKQLDKFPISFKYNGEEIQGFPKELFGFKSQKQSKTEDKESAEIILAFADDIEVNLQWAFYHDFGTTEWTVYFKNVGKTDSGVFENLRTELLFPGQKPLLKGIRGDHWNQYRPYCVDLEQRPERFVSDSGRATHVNFPYFNLECGTGGTLLALGWAGTWTASFRYEQGITKYVANSINGLKTYLKPGETLRSALFVCLPYEGRNETDAMNIWRRWFLKHNIPRADKEGNAVEPFSTCCLAHDTGRPNSDGSISEDYTTWRPSLEKMIEEDCKVDVRWVDAGWYSAPDGSKLISDWRKIGSWEMCPHKWPDDTFLESVEYAREQDMQTLLWFELEWVIDTEMLEKFCGYNPDWAIEMISPECRGEHKCNNIGIPECRKWLTERVCNALRKNKIEIFREDNNRNPGPHWRYYDEVKEGKNRNGITENNMVMGHYQILDDIIACTSSYGGAAFCDSCASGGGRNDIESLRRAIPLLRSDSDRTTTSLRLSMTRAFNQWIPFCGANTREKKHSLAPVGKSDQYVWRASYLPVLNVDSQFVYEPSQDFSVLRKGLSEWKKLNKYLLKDFYPLTPWHSENEKDGFTAFSFYDPEEEKGILLIFRMEECLQEEITVNLPFANEGEQYKLTDEDSGEVTLLSGGKLGSDITFNLPEKRMARLVWIEKVGEH